MENKFKVVKNAGIAGIIGNIFLLVIKGFIGFATHSQSMIADSLNSAADILASLMTFIGNKISSEPKDQDHNFGHGKAEYIFSLFISISMLGVALKLFIDSAINLVKQNYFTFSWFLIIVCIITIITKFILYLYTKTQYKKFNNILLKSSYQDHRNDCFVTTGTLISILLGTLNILWVDGVTGMLISIWIFISGLKIFIESYNVLMDISLDEHTKQLIMDFVMLNKEVKNCYNFYSAPVGAKYFIAFTIAVDGNMTTYNSHKLANKLEKDVEALEKIYKVIIHVHPEEL